MRVRAEAVVRPPAADTPLNPTTPLSRLPAALIAAGDPDPDPMRLSQMRVGAFAWYWYPSGVAVAVALPNQPFASTIMLTVPAALYTGAAAVQRGPGARLLLEHQRVVGGASTARFDSLRCWGSKIIGAS